MDLLVSFSRVLSLNLAAFHDINGKVLCGKYSGESMPPTPWIGSLQQTFTRTPVQYILEPLQVGKDSEGGFACVIQSCFKFKPGCIS